MALSWSMFKHIQRLLATEARFLPDLSPANLPVAIQLEVLAAQTCARWAASTLTSSQFRLITGFVVLSIRHTRLFPTQPLPDDVLAEVAKGNPKFHSSRTLRLMYDDLCPTAADAQPATAASPREEKRSKTGVAFCPSKVESPKGGTCVVCWDRSAVTVTLPCRHSSMCRECSEVLIDTKSTCPCCRSTIERIEWFFPP
jgi:hypothetical protein